MSVLFNKHAYISNNPLHNSVHRVYKFLFSGKGPSVTGLSPISCYLDDFSEEKMCQTIKVIDRPSPISEAIL